MAYCRGYHTMNDDPKIFDDFLSDKLLGKELHVLLDNRFTPSVQFIKSIDSASVASCHQQAVALAWSMRVTSPLSLAVSRARYAEDALEQAVRQGVKQYVIPRCRSGCLCV